MGGVNRYARALAYKLIDHFEESGRARATSEPFRFNQLLICATYDCLGGVPCAMGKFSQGHRVLRVADWEP